MKFAIYKTEMLAGLQRVQNVVERKTTMPILSNALLRATENGLSLAATDLEIGIESVLQAEIMEAGAITIKAKTLLDIVRELPETTLKCETKENNRLEITANKSVFNIVGLPADDFPEIPSLGTLEDRQFIRMNSMAVTAMLDKTLYAASTDEARYYLNGIFFETIEGNAVEPMLRMVATDAHRLSLVDNADVLFEDRAWSLFKEGVILPRKGLSELRRLLSEGKDDFYVSLKERMFFAKRENIFLSVRLIEGRYADYRRIIPEKSQLELLMKKEEFLASLRRISLMAGDKSKSIGLAVLPGLIQLTGQSPELGEAKEEISVDYEGPELKIGFNSRYLIEALSTMEGENVLLELKDKNSPGVIRSTDGTNHITVVMPMRI